MCNVEASDQSTAFRTIYAKPKFNVEKIIV
jgi:hypothetical protein